MDSKVFGIDDLRRYIFSFLRKEPQRTCKECKDVCVWDKRVKYYVVTTNTEPKTLCLECWQKYTDPSKVIQSNIV